MTKADKYVNEGNNNLGKYNWFDLTEEEKKTKKRKAGFSENSAVILI